MTTASGFMYLNANPRRLFEMLHDHRPVHLGRPGPLAPPSPHHRGNEGTGPPPCRVYCSNGGMRLCESPPAVDHGYSHLPVTLPLECRHVWVLSMRAGWAFSDSARWTLQFMHGSSLGERRGPLRGPSVGRSCPYGAFQIVPRPKKASIASTDVTALVVGERLRRLGCARDSSMEHGDQSSLEVRLRKSVLGFKFKLEDLPFD